LGRSTPSREEALHLPLAIAQVDIAEDIPFTDLPE